MSESEEVITILFAMCRHSPPSKIIPHVAGAQMSPLSELRRRQASAMKQQADNEPFHAAPKRPFNEVLFKKHQNTKTP